jgi:chemotaxis family two-component system response regulator PixH
VSHRIVVIDDSEIVLAALSLVLGDAGFEVRTVNNLRHLLNAVLDWKPQLIVTDLYMPGMTGAEVCAWLRKQPATARIPIVICSSAPTDELARVARDVTADGYVSKEDGPEALAAKLHALCEEIVF